jgi:tetratricopeptide (TPR) repeat protein
VAVKLWLLFGLVLLSLASPSLASDGSDWYTVSGTSFIEAVGTGTSYLLVTKDASGRFSVLGPGESFAPGMTLKKIGSMQVMVARGAEQTAAPILRAQIPADVLVVAICRLYNQNVIVAGQVDSMVAYVDGLLNYKQELPGLMKSLGLSYTADDRAIVIRKEGAAKPLPGPGLKKETAYQGQHVRSTAAEIVDAMNTQAQRRYAPASGAGVATVYSADLSPEELAAYLGTALETEIVEKPAPAAPATTTPPATPATTATGSGLDEVRSAFERAVKLTRANDQRQAATVLLQLVKTHPELPPKVTNLLGKLLWSLGRKDQARKAWARSLRADPQDAFARNALAKTAPKPR